MRQAARFFFGGTVAASVTASRRGASVIRVHDVREVRQALLVDAALSAGDGEMAAQ